MTQFVHRVVEVPLSVCVSMYFIHARCINQLSLIPVPLFAGFKAGVALCCARPNPGPASAGTLQHLCAVMQE